MVYGIRDAGEASLAIVDKGLEDRIRKRQSRKRKLSVLSFFLGDQHTG